MYDISGFRPQNKETALAIIVCVAVLVAVFCVGYGIGGRNSERANTDSLPVGVGQVRQHLESVAAAQREIEERIDRQQNSAAQISARIDSGAAGIEKAAAATGRAESIVRESEDLIADGQRILREIRSRRKAEKAQN